MGVVCNDCEYSLKISLIEEQAIEDGKTILFHLKKGDKKLFMFTPTEKTLEYVQLISFNLKMKKYTMEVEMSIFY